MADRRFVNKILTDNERVISQFGYHWTRYFRPRYLLAHIVPAGVSGAAFAILAYLIPEKALYAGLVAGGLWFFVAWFIWVYITSDVRIVTNKRVVLKEGFFNRKTQEVKLSALEAIEFEQTFLERILGVGCLEISGRGGGAEITFHHVANPVQTKYLIENINWRETGDGAYDPEIDG